MISISSCICLKILVGMCKIHDDPPTTYIHPLAFSKCSHIARFPFELLFPISNKKHALNTRPDYNYLWACLIGNQMCVFFLLGRCFRLSLMMIIMMMIMSVLHTLLETYGQQRFDNDEDDDDQWWCWLQSSLNGGTRRVRVYILAAWLQDHENALI